MLPSRALATATVMMSSSKQRRPAGKRVFLRLAHGLRLCPLGTARQKRKARLPLPMGHGHMADQTVEIMVGARADPFLAAVFVLDQLFGSDFLLVCAWKVMGSDSSPSLERRQKISFLKLDVSMR